MLKINNLIKCYKNTTAVNDITLNINKGDIYGFIGPNGAGKSTTIRCILKLVNITSGTILVNKQNIIKSESYKEEIGYLPSEINLYDSFTVKEIFKYNQTLLKKDCTKKVDELVKLLDIDITKKIKELSFGNLKKVGIVNALMHEPKLLILDEPTSGLDPLKQKIFYNLLKEEKNKGTTIFFSSHNLEEVKKVCDKIAFIKDGKIILNKSIDELNKDNYLIVTICSNDIKKMKFNDILEKDDNYIKFIYKKSINHLIQELSKYNIEKLNIEKPTLEDIFITYYKEKTND